MTEIQQTTPTAEKPSTTVEMQHLYVKEQSCKVPHGVDALKITDNKPETHTEMNISHSQLNDDRHEITLSITVTSKINNRTAFIVEVKQAGVFKTNSKDKEQLTQLCNIHIPTMLYPYVRKVIADAIMNAGFPSFFLPHVDFVAMYHNNKAKAEGQNQSTAQILEKVSETTVH